MNIVSDRDGFVWKGHDQLTPRGGTLSLAPGFQPNSVLQLHPPAAITALASHAEWGLVAAGTAHGLALFDYIRHNGVLTKCTLNPNGMLYNYVIVLKIYCSHGSLESLIFTALWSCYLCTRMHNVFLAEEVAVIVRLQSFSLYSLFVVHYMLIIHS
jgi:hypothetical protein